MTLLQATQAVQTSFNDLSFSTKDVTMLVGGILTLAAQFFYFKFDLGRVKENHSAYVIMNDKITDKISEHVDDKVEKMSGRMDKMEERHGNLKQAIFDKMDEQNEKIGDLQTSIEKMKSEILQRLLDKK